MYQAVCVDCGGPRHPLGGQRCRACYLARADKRRAERMLLEVLTLPRRVERQKKRQAQLELKERRETERNRKRQLRTELENKRQLKRIHKQQAKLELEKRRERQAWLRERAIERQQEKERYKPILYKEGYCRRCLVTRLSVAHTKGLCDECLPVKKASKITSD